MGFGFGYALFWKRFILEVLTCFDLVFITMYSYSLLAPAFVADFPLDESNLIQVRFKYAL